MLTGEIVPVSGSMKMDDWDNKALRLIITKPTTDTNIYCALTITVSISPDPIDFSLRQNNMPATTNTTLTITIDNSTLVGAIDLFNINNFQDLIISNISVHSGISNTSNNDHTTSIGDYEFKVSINPSISVCTPQSDNDETDTEFEITSTP